MTKQMASRYAKGSKGDKGRMLDEPRYLTIEQALIITDVYQAHEDDSAARKRALSLAEAMRRLAIHIDPDELIVGNRTTGVRGGVVSLSGRAVAGGRGLLLRGRVHLL